MTDYIFNLSDFKEEDYNFYYHKMSDSRRKRVDNKKFLDDKKRTVLGEAIIKKHFGDDSVIEILPGGKPYLKNKKGEFSISHSGNFIAAAISEFPVGIDIECVRDVNLKAAQKLCNKEELLYIFKKIPGEEDYIKKEKEILVRFFEIWTFKEAYFKYLGTGITDFLKVDYFNEDIKRIKKIKENYVVHIVY